MILIGKFNIYYEGIMIDDKKILITGGAVSFGKTIVKKLL
tara:strand:+ start:621 stop:740 length:120 start_codon:yes stop_codon:yes gene_type:complete